MLIFNKFLCFIDHWSDIFSSTSFFQPYKAFWDERVALSGLSEWSKIFRKALTFLAPEEILLLCSHALLGGQSRGIYYQLSLPPLLPTLSLMDIYICEGKTGLGAPAHSGIHPI